MDKTYCENCGSKVYGGHCVNCHEETYIARQNYQNDDRIRFSDKFNKKLTEQAKEAKIIREKNGR